MDNRNIEEEGSVRFDDIQAPDFVSVEDEHKELISQRFLECGVDPNEVTPFVINQLALIEKFAPVHNQHSLKMIKIFQIFRNVYNESIAPKTVDASDVITIEEMKLINYLILTHDIGKANSNDPELVTLILTCYSHKGRIDPKVNVDSGLEGIFSDSQLAVEISDVSETATARVSKVLDYFKRSSHPEIRLLASGQATMSDFWTRCHSILGYEALNHSAQTLADNKKLNEREKLAALFAELHHVFEGRIPLEFNDMSDLKTFMDLYIHTRSEDAKKQVVGEPIDNSEKIANLLSILVLLDKFEAGINREDREAKDSDLNIRITASLNNIQNILNSTHIDEVSGLAKVIENMLKVYNNSEFKKLLLSE